MTTTDLDIFAPAATMLRALRQRQVLAVELLERHVRRIERYNPALNAVVVTDFERARERAVAADARRTRGEDGPLLGLPMTVKESINVAGLGTTAGMPDWASFISEVDGPVAARLQAAGAVLIGKTNVPPMLADWQSNNPVYGRTNNPWDLGRSPGGSSGGSAAALAAGLTPLEFGSDIGGSIRVPAAFCGVYGHRPSETALPRSGQLPIPPMPNAAAAMGVQGPLARSAEDLELTLDVAAGPDVGEDVAWTLTIPPARHDRLADFRVAVLPLPDWLPIDAEITAAFEDLAAGLARAGARVERAQPEGFGDLREHHEQYCSLLMAQMSRRLPAEARTALAEAYRRRGDHFSVACARGVEATAGDYLSLHEARERERAAYRAFFREWDVLLAPVTIVPAFPHRAMPFPPLAPLAADTLEVNGSVVAYDLQLVPPGISTFSGQPATAFPMGLTRAGLPIGLQAIGPYLEDRTPIRFAALVGREFDGMHRPPGYEE